MIADWVGTVAATIIGGALSVSGGILATRRAHVRAVRIELYLGDFPRLSDRLGTIESLIDSQVRGFTRDLTNGLEEARRKARTGARWDRRLAEDMAGFLQAVVGSEEALAAQHATRGTPQSPQALDGRYWVEMGEMATSWRSRFDDLARQLDRKI